MKLNKTVNLSVKQCEELIKLLSFAKDYLEELPEESSFFVNKKAALQKYYDYVELLDPNDSTLC